MEPIKSSIPEITYELIPEHFEGNFPHFVVLIKKSQLNANLQSLIEECITKITGGYEWNQLQR